MINYVDEDFFKFLLGFVAIVSISLIIVFATKVYSANKMEANAGTITNSM